MSIDQIACDALRLNPRDRAILSEAIWESLGDPYLFTTDISQREAIELAKRRDEDIQRKMVIPLSPMKN